MIGKGRVVFNMSIPNIDYIALKKMVFDAYQKQTNIASLIRRSYRKDIATWERLNKRRMNRKRG